MSERAPRTDPRPPGTERDQVAEDALALEAEAASEGRLAALSGVIAWRVRARSRELGLSATELARRTGLSKPMISKIQAARGSPSLGTLLRLADALEMPVTSLFQGLDEERDALFTKAGAGPELGRPGTRSGHRYQLLGSMRGPAKRMEPMLVTLTSEAEVFPLYQHPGTELLYMLEGEMAYGYGGAVYEMAPGDALQLDGEVPHGPVRLSLLPVRFLSVTAYGPPPLDARMNSVHGPREDS